MHKLNVNKKEKKKNAEKKTLEGCKDEVNNSNLISYSSFIFFNLLKSRPFVMSSASRICWKETVTGKIVYLHSSIV